MKEYNSKIFLANQNNYEKVDYSQLDNFDSEIEAKNKYINELKSKQIQLNKQLKYLNEELTNDELNKRIKDSKDILNSLKMKVKKFECNSYEAISDEKIKESEKVYNDSILKYKSVRKVCKNIQDFLSEAMEVDYKRLAETEMISFEDEGQYLNMLNLKLG